MVMTFVLLPFVVRQKLRLILSTACNNIQLNSKFMKDYDFSFYKEKNISGISDAVSIKSDQIGVY